MVNPPNQDQGSLLPQLTSSERNAIAPTSPQDDVLIVFDTTDKSLYYWSGGPWIKGLGESLSNVLSYDGARQTLLLSGYIHSKRNSLMIILRARILYTLVCAFLVFRIKSGLPDFLYLIVNNRVIYYYFG